MLLTQVRSTARREGFSRLFPCLWDELQGMCLPRRAVVPGLSPERSVGDMLGPGVSESSRLTTALQILQVLGLAAGVPVPGRGFPREMGRSCVFWCECVLAIYVFSFGNCSYFPYFHRFLVFPLLTTDLMLILWLYVWVYISPKSASRVCTCVCAQACACEFHGLVRLTSSCFPPVPSVAVDPSCLLRTSHPHPRMPSSTLFFWVFSSPVFHV